MKAIDALKETAAYLENYGIESPEKEAELLIRHGLNIDSVEIYRDNPELNEECIKTVKEMLQRRLSREPLQYILGYVEFLGLRLAIGRGVLIPRPETEMMAEYAIKTARSQKLEVRSQKSEVRIRNTDNCQLSTVNRQQFTILDLCTGSGCLALALAKEFPDALVYGTDISENAIESAKKNAELNCINNATFLKGSLFEPIEKLFTIHYSLFTFDLIVSNPPYIRTRDIKSLQPEIRDWEPADALDGGADGLDFYRKLIPASRQFLKDNGILMLEVGAGQSDDVADIIKSLGFARIETIKDYAGIKRIVKARWTRL